MPHTDILIDTSIVDSDLDCLETCSALHCSALRFCSVNFMQHVIYNFIPPAVASSSWVIGSRLRLIS